LHFPGTLVVVSHDREFLQGLTNKTLEFTPKGIKTHLGGIDEFLRNKQLESFAELERDKAKKESPAKPQVQAVEPKAMSKDQQQQAKQVQRNLEKAEAEVQKLEEQLAVMDAKLQDSEEFKTLSPSFFAEYESLRKKLDVAMQNWEKAVEEASANPSIS
jgi:ATP-binding cassette subfamily F protein 3